MQVLIIMPSYSAFVNFKDGNSDFITIPIPIEILPVEKSLIKQAVREILMSLGIN